MKTTLSILFSLISLCALAQDHSFPEEIHEQYDIDIKQYYKNNHIVIDVHNTLKAPLRITVKTDNPNLNKKYKLNDTVTLKYKEKRQLKYYVPSKYEFEYTTSIYIGDTEAPIKKNELSLPFPKGKTYEIMQGYNGYFSHNNDYNRYAIDFDLKVNDTICSADDGIVVGVIKDYKYGGASRKWRDNNRVNLITIYHPHSGIYTEYLHLVHLGSFVKVGDEVKRGQPIGLAGVTGFTTGEHLHFNALIPEKGGNFISIPITFENGIKGEDLKEGKKIKR